MVDVYWLPGVVAKIRFELPLNGLPSRGTNVHRYQFFCSR